MIVGMVADITGARDARPAIEPDLTVLEKIEQRVLWLATRIVDAANHDRETGDGVKVGGHQASSASLVSVMTALYFAYLDAPDRVSVKPHASPVYHAIQYLLGNLDRGYLPRLRAFGGLQSYPSRTKDPDQVDFSTGSVGLGAAAPLFAAAARRYVDAHFGPRPRSRYIALIGDAELDEGNIWEAVADPATDGLGDVLWIVDVNRQSLDRVVPGVRIAQWEQQFTAAGWHVAEAKYGRRLQAAFGQPGGAVLRDWIDAMPNEQYQSLFGLDPAGVRARFCDGAPAEVTEFCAGLPDDELAGLVTDLAGHDLATLLDAFAECDKRPRPAQRAVRLHDQGLGAAHRGQPAQPLGAAVRPQIGALRERLGLTEATEWDRLDPMTPAGQWAAARREHLARAPDHAGAGGRGAGRHRGPRGPADLDPGGVRADPGRAVPVPGRGPVPGHHRAGRGHLDQPGRVHQPDGRVQPRRPAVLERGSRAEVGRGAVGAAHRAGHQRDEPVPAARPARPGLGPVRPAAAAGGHGL